MKIVAGLCLLVAAHAGIAAEAFRVEPWSLGDTRAEVEEHQQFGPFIPVSVTGGLETQNAQFLNGRRTVSFVFDENDRVEYIQIWMYEGRKFASARKEALRIYDLFQKDFGGASIPGVEAGGRSSLERRDFISVLDKMLARSPRLGAKLKAERNVVATTVLDLVPTAQPANSKLVAQLVHNSRNDDFFVFLFQDSKTAPDRRALSMIRLESL